MGLDGEGARLSTLTIAGQPKASKVTLIMMMMIMIKMMMMIIIKMMMKMMITIKL